jgi:hypothetical protein
LEKYAFDDNAVVDTWRIPPQKGGHLTRARALRVAGVKTAKKIADTFSP